MQNLQLYKNCGYVTAVWISGRVVTVLVQILATMHRVQLWARCLYTCLCDQHQAVVYCSRSCLFVGVFVCMFVGLLPR